MSDSLAMATASFPSPPSSPFSAQQIPNSILRRRSSTSSDSSASDASSAVSTATSKSVRFLNWVAVSYTYGDDDYDRTPVMSQKPKYQHLPHYNPPNYNNKQRDSFTRPVNNNAGLPAHLKAASAQLAARAAQHEQNRIEELLMSMRSGN